MYFPISYRTASYGIKIYSDQTKIYSHFYNYMFFKQNMRCSRNILLLPNRGYASMTNVKDFTMCCTQAWRDIFPLCRHTRVSRATDKLDMIKVASNRISGVHIKRLIIMSSYKCVIFSSKKCCKNVETLPTV